MKNNNFCRNPNSILRQICSRFSEEHPFSKTLEFSWNSVIKGVFHKDHILIGSSIIGFLLFQEIIKSGLSTYWVSPLMAKIEGNATNDKIIFIVAVLFLAYITHKAINRYNSSFLQRCIFGSLLTLHIYYRWINDDVWIYKHFTWGWLNNLAYLDIIYLIALFPLIRLFTKFSIINNNLNVIVKEDLPLYEGGNNTDTLNRAEFVSAISKLIKVQNFKKAFSIGIVGPWGAGKTSFVNMIQNELVDEKNILFINFNAFYNHEPKTIITDFFKQLSQALKPYNANLSNKLESYGNYIVNALDGSFGKWTKSLWNVIRHEEVSTVSDQYDKINKALTKLGKKLVIAIDDMDRLESAEIIQILKLVRNTANFHNTVYIIGLDKEYVISAIQEKDKSKDQRFLEKFFQYEFLLPQPKNDALLASYINLLRKNNFLNDEEISSITADFTPILFDSEELSTVFGNIVKNIRDVIRLFNNFKMDYKYVEGEVDAKEFTIIQILKLKYPSALQKLASNKTKYLTKAKDFDQYIHVIDVSSKEENKKNKKLLITDLQNEGVIKKPYEIEHLDTILNSLFHEPNEIHHHRQVKIPIKSIKHPDKTNLYLYFDKRSTKLLDTDFMYILEKGLDIRDQKTQEILRTWNNYDTLMLLAYRIREVDSYKEQIFTNAIDIITHCLLHFKCENFVDDHLIASIPEILKKVPSDMHKATTNHLFNKFLDPLTLKPPHLLQSKLVKALYMFVIIDEDNRKQIFSKEYLSSLQLKYLKLYFKEISIIDWDVYRLYHMNNDIGNGKAANKLFIQHLRTKEYKQFLTDIINRRPFEHRYEISGIVVDIFGSFKDFKAFIDSLDQDEFIKEFILFYEKLELNNFTNHVLFDFQVIPLREYPHEISDNEFYADIIFEVDPDFNKKLQKHKSSLEFAQPFDGGRVEIDFKSGREDLLQIDYYGRTEKDSYTLLTESLNFLIKYFKKIYGEEHTPEINLDPPYDSIISHKSTVLVKVWQSSPNLN